jgi:hypothetical protein
LHEIFKVHVRRKMSFSITRPAPRDVAVAVIPEILKVRPVNKRNVRVRGSQGLATLFCRFLEPSLLDEAFEALESGVQVCPVGEDLVGETGGEGADLFDFEWFGRWQIPAVAEAAAFAWHAIEVAVCGYDLCVDVRRHNVCGTGGQRLPPDEQYSNKWCEKAAEFCVTASKGRMRLDKDIPATFAFTSSRTDV